MKKIIYLSGVLLCMSLGVFAADEPALEQDEVAILCEQEFDLSEISLEDLDTIEKDESLSFSQKASAFYAVLSYQAAKAKQVAREKLELANKHVLENKKAYITGLILGAAATTGLIIYLYKDKLFPATTT